MTPLFSLVQFRYFKRPSQLSSFFIVSSTLICCFRTLQIRSDEESRILITTQLWNSPTISIWRDRHLLMILCIVFASSSCPTAIASWTSLLLLICLQMYSYTHLLWPNLQLSKDIICYLSIRPNTKSTPSRLEWLSWKEDDGCYLYFSISWIFFVFSFSFLL